MAQNHDNLVATISAGSQSRFHEPAADSFPLLARQSSHRSERQGIHRSNLCDDADSAEEDVADDLPVQLGHERDFGEAAVTQRIDEPRLGVTLERRLMDAPDRYSVFVGFQADHKAHSQQISVSVTDRTQRPNEPCGRSSQPENQLRPILFPFEKNHLVGSSTACDYIR